MGNESHCLGAQEASWIHTAKGFRTPAAGTCSILGHSAPQSGSLHSSSRHLQNPEAGKAEKEPLRKVSENVNYFAPVSKTKLFYSLPSPSIPQALPGPSPQPQAHLENMEMSEAGWGYQSTVPGKNSSLGAQVTSAHSPGERLLSCHE